MGIAELSIPGVTASRALAVPEDVAPAPDQRTNFAFTRGSQPRYACVAEHVRRAAGPASGEEPSGVHRLFRTDTNDELPDRGHRPARRSAARTP